MELLITIAVLYGIYWWIFKREDYIFDNRIAPPGHRTDYGKMMDDMRDNKISKDQAIKNANRGKYDVKSDLRK